MIKERICSYKLSKLLQEKGFDEECANWYVDEQLAIITVNDCIGPQSNSDHYASDFECSAPTHQMAMDWLRIVHRIHIFMLPSRLDDNYFKYEIIRSSCPLCPYEDIKLASYFVHGFGEAVEEACTDALRFVKKSE